MIITYSMAGTIMTFFDRNAFKNIGRYIFQCFLATCTILIVLLFLDALTYPALLATLGATVFIVFTMPNAYSSRIRSLVGGYFVGISVGALFSVISKLPVTISLLPSLELTYCVFGGLAVGTAIFVMVITNTEHPPASGIALALVINPWDILTILFLLCIIIILAIIHKWMRPILIDLT